ncbi:MAG: putative rane protein [Deltaproteobacteria bacterium]|nr:putative rane protein [Deltaproteobacteria bacterium]
MVAFRSAGWLFPVLIGLFIFPSCAQMKSFPSPQPSVQAPQPSVQARNEIKQHLGAAQYRKALDDYRSEFMKHPHDQALMREYVRSIEDIKTKADKISDAGDLASAARIYDTLLKTFSDFKTFAHLLSFDSVELNTELRKCKTSLSKQGFQAYRNGNLNEAITLWRGYLSVDPNNADIKRAANTAMVQQKNLQEK